MHFARRPPSYANDPLLRFKVGLRYIADIDELTCMGMQTRPALSDPGIAAHRDEGGCP